MSACVVGLVEHSAHPVMSIGGTDDRDDSALGDEFALGLELVEDAPNCHQDVGDVRAAMVIPDGTVEDDVLAERVVEPVLSPSLCEWK